MFVSKLIARLAMVASFIYYSVTLGVFWVAAFLGDQNRFWQFLEFPENLPMPPIWTYWAGILMSLIALSGLAFSYLSIERIFRSDLRQNFLLLSRAFKNTSLGIMAFWLGYNLITGLLPVLFALHLQQDQHPPLDWDPLDTDIILLIIAIAMFAISKALHHAWIFEDENKHFL
jgi:drug/metabolite transporter (DMT)-like permease